MSKVTIPIFVIYKKFCERVPIEYFSTLEKARDYLRWAEYPMHEKRMKLIDSDYYIELISSYDVDSMSEYIEDSLKRKRRDNVRYED